MSPDVEESRPFIRASLSLTLSLEIGLARGKETDKARWGESRQIFLHEALVFFTSEPSFYSYALIVCAGDSVTDLFSL